MDKFGKSGLFHGTKGDLKIDAIKERLKIQYCMLCRCSFGDSGCLETDCYQDLQTVIEALERNDLMDSGKGGYWERVCAIQERQTKKGLQKYGMRLEDYDLPSDLIGMVGSFVVAAYMLEHDEKVRKNEIEFKGECSE